MPSIDDRIVSMEFDNARFQQKTAETVSTLEKLQKSLDMAGAKQGLTEVSAAADKFHLGNMAHAVEGIAGKFSTLGITAITVLSNIVNKATDAGLRLAKSLSVQPIMEGFREYELNMGSIQTILSNTKDKGGNLETVNDALDKLNQYSDKTIYNFGQMAKNIGTFTAAGVGLDESVKSIKGIANLAALSGSTSEQASTAMYQLSQALAAGKVNLMDWNSVVNAGMGGELFKKALFETGKAMKTITDVPMGASFEEWEKKGGTFREQMQNGWLTSDVLATTLQGLSGDLDKAGLKALGFGDAAANKLVELGTMGQAAATEVKTISQLMSTLKEGVASGWAQSFRTIVGDFEQAKTLFTDINRVVGGALGASAEARNALLKNWADLGGRTAILDGFKNAFNSLGMIVNSLRDAFREIFPPITAERLVELSNSFREFTDRIRIATYLILPTLRHVFKGLFAALEIGWTVVKETARFFKDLFKSMFPDDGGSEILGFFARIASFLIGLNEKLVAGGGIRDFFEGLTEAIHKPRESLDNFIAKVKEFFGAFSTDSLKGTGDAVESFADRVASRFQFISDTLKKGQDVWASFTDVIGNIVDVLERVWNTISNWFSELGSRIASVLRPTDFDAAVDIVNVGLLGGILVLLRKFLNEGISLFAGGGLAEKITSVLDIMEIRLKQMQNSIKADILLKIAGAVGILAASAVILSLVDSAALTKAMVALGVGFAQLAGTMAVLDKMSAGPKGAAKMAAISAALIALSTASLIMAGAVTVLSKLGWEELAKGMAGIAGMIAVMVTAANLVTANTKGLVTGSVAMIAMATALNILAQAVKSFSDLSWEEMGKGMFGIAVGLGVIVTAMNLMPVASTIAAGLAMIPLATGLTILAGAVALFGLMDWEQLGKGLLGLAGALGIIALAMNFMPVTTPIIAAGLVLVAGAMVVMTGAIAALGALPMENLLQGIGALAGLLLVLGVALYGMTGSIAGAAALVVAAGALAILTPVLIALSKLKLNELAIALGAIAGVLAILGIGAALLTPVIPSMLALGKAMALIGASFALFGTGVMFVAKAFEILAKSGRAGVDAFIGILEEIIGAVPRFIAALVTSVSKSAAEILEAVDLILRVVAQVLAQVLDTIILLTPKIARAIIEIVLAGLRMMRENFPAVLQTGIALLMALLRGVRDNIGEVVSLATEIIINFAKSIVDNSQKLTDAAVSILLSFITALAERVGDIVLAGLGLLVGLIKGITDNLNLIVEAVGMMIAWFIYNVGVYTLQIIRVGGDMIIALIKGIGQKTNEIVSAGVDVILSFLEGIGSNAVRLAEGAADVLVDFLNGMATAIRDKSADIRKAGLNVADAIIDGITGGLTSKANLNTVIQAVKDMANLLPEWAQKILGIESPSKVFAQIGRYVGEGLAVGLDKDTSAENSAVASAERIIEAFSQTLSRVPDTLGDIGEFHPVITPVLDLSKVESGARGLGALMEVGSISPDLSVRQARLISTTTDVAGVDETPAYQGPSEVKFEQNIYSPTALTTNDIYKRTRSQLTLAKEELGIK